MSDTTGEQRWRIAMSIGLLTLAAVLLLARLGHNPLWCDEADTALFAAGICTTGDTSAVFGHNVYAYRGGVLLDGLTNRYTPPLAYYLAAPFWATYGAEPFWLRLPFALCGWLTIALLVRWLWRAEATRTTWLMLSFALATNVSFWLFARQCRYYALATLATTVAGYLYVSSTRSDQRNTLRIVALALTLLALLATQYLNFAALLCVAAVDYTVWRHRERPFTRREWAILLLPLLIGGALAWFYWNPLGKTQLAENVGRNLWLDKLTLFWWNLRDLNRCEFGLGWLLAATPLVGWWRGDRWLVRGTVALVVYVVAVTVASPQSVAISHLADVRYLAPLIPLCLFLTVRTLQLALSQQTFLPWFILIIACCSNVLHRPLTPTAWQSTPTLFAQELISPRETTLAQTIAWVQQNVKEGESVWVVPGFQMYPLMVHAPAPVYAWQLNADVAGPLAELPAIHRLGREPIDYAIVFGPFDPQVRGMIAELERRGHRYRRERLLDVYHEEGTRPEMYEHLFHPVGQFDHATEAVYLYRRLK